MDRVAMNQKRIQRWKDAKSSWKNRKGGISDDAWKDLSKKEKKKMQEAGLRMNSWRADPTLNDKGLKAGQ